MSIRITRLAALAAAMLFATGASSQAAFTLSTSIASVTGLTGPTALSAGNITIPGVTFTVGAAGGTSYTDTAGSTVYILNDTQTVNSVGVTNEQIYINAVATDTSTFNVTLNIAVNGTNAFLETLGLNPISGIAGYANLISAGQTSIIGPATTSVTGSYSVGGLTVLNLSSAATSGNANSSQNPTISATFIGTLTVPEPASIAMLGLGLVSVGGLALRRRMAK
jgi:hypothetical protein